MPLFRPLPLLAPPTLPDIDLPILHVSGPIGNEKQRVGLLGTEASPSILVSCLQGIVSNLHDFP